MRSRSTWVVGLCTMLVAGSAAAQSKPTLEQGRAKQAVGDYDEAAAIFEDVARVSPQRADAPEALEDAIVLRLSLGQIDRAAEDAKLFARNYGAKKPADTARTMLAVAKWRFDHGDYPTAKKELAGAMSLIDRGGALDTRVLAHALLGHTLLKLDDKGAASEYEVVRGLWKDAEAATRAVQQSGDDRRLGAALTAVGEAVFFAAEQESKKVDAIRLPEYKGKGDREEVLKWVNTKVVAWVKAKRPAIEAAEREYQKVLQIQPMPPPRWVTAAAARVGVMWAKFVAEFRTTPVPREWKGNGTVPGTTITYKELRQTYYQTIDDAAEPMKQRAKAAFKVCVNYSVKYQYADEHTERCHQWLSRNFRTEFPLVDDIAPRWGGLGPATPPPQPLAESP